MTFKFPKKLPKKWIEEIERNGRVGSLVHGLKVVGKDKRGTIVHLGKDSFKILHNGKNQNVFGNPLVGGLDPNFGYETKGATEIQTAGNYLHATKFYCPESGTATSITAYIKFYSTTQKVKFAIYTDNAGYPNTLVGYTEEGTIESGWDNWKTLNIVSGGSLSAGYYWLVWWADGILYFYYDAGDTGQHVAKVSVTYDGFPSTFPSGGTSSARKYSIYCTYSTGGAILKEVADSLSLSETLLCNKTFAVTDSVGLADAPLKHWTPQISDSIALSDAVLRNKTFQIFDSLGLSDTILRGKQFSVSDFISLCELITVITEIIKQVTDSLSLSDIVSLNKALLVADQIRLTDNVYVNKILIISDSMALAEVVEKSVQGVVKTKVFLIMGDLAIQLTG